MPGEKNLSLQYELEVLDELVLEKMNPEQNPEPNFMVLLSECVTIAKKQKEVISKKMVTTVYTFTKEKHTLTYIHNHQARLSFLIEQLSKYLEHDLVISSKEYQEIIDQILKQIASLVRFLADTFKEYFNYDAESTVTFKKTAASFFADEVKKLESKLNVACPPILELALGPVKEFINNPLTKSTTFRRLMYFDTLLKEIEPLIQPDGINSKTLVLLLVSLNFNSSGFMWYITYEIEQAVLKMETHSQKIEKLSWYLKQFNQTHVKSDIVLEKNQEPIKERLINWILEEVGYLERTIRAEHILNEPNKEPADLPIFFETNLSVPQLGYFFKVMVDIKVFKDINITQMLRYVAEHSRSINSAGNIGYQSLRKNFYNNETSTKQAIKDVLIRMLNEVNKNL